MSRIPPSLWLAPLLLLPAVVQAQEPDPRELFERGYFQEHALKQLDQAIGTYRRVAELAGEKDRPLAGRALVRVAACEQARGRDVEAREVLQDVLQRFADVPAVKQEAEQLLGQAKGPRRSLRLYDVQELLTRIPDLPAYQGSLVPRPRQSGKAEGGALFFDDGPDVPEGTALEPDQLIELIQHNVAEDSWANERNSLELRNGQLIVTQTAEVHQQIAGYLERLRALRGRVVTVELTLALLEPGLARELARAGGPGPLPDAQVAALEQRLRGAQPGARLLARQRVSASDLQLVNVAAVRELAYLQQRANDTGVVPVLDPTVLSGTEGFVGQLRPRLVGDDCLLLEVTGAWSQWSFRQPQVEAGDLALPREQRLGDVIQLPRADVFQLQSTQLLRAGTTQLMGVIRAPRLAVDGLADPYVALLARSELSKLATGNPEAPGSNETRLLRVHDVTLLTTVPETWDLVGDLKLLGDGYESDETPGVLSSETLVDLIERNVASEAWTSALNAIQAFPGGKLAVVSTPEVQAQVEAFLATLRRARGRSLQLEVARLSLGAEELARLVEAGRGAGPGAFVVPAAAAAALEGDAARVLGWAEVTTWEGQVVRVCEGGFLGYLARHERHSGGTGMVVASTTVPLAGVTDEGTRFEARARLLPDGKHAAVELILNLGHLDPFVEVPTSTGPIELPRRRRRNHHCEINFPIDQVLVVNAGLGDPADPLRGVVLVRVRARNLLGGE